MDEPPCRPDGVIEVLRRYSDSLNSAYFTGRRGRAGNGV